MLTLVKACFAILIHTNCDLSVLLVDASNFISNPIILVTCLQYNLGFPGGAEVKASACNVGDLGSIPGQEDPLEKAMSTHSSILAWGIPWMEEFGHSSRVAKSQTRLSDFTFT